MVSTPLKNISQNGNLPQIGVNIKNIWNHHPVIIFASKLPPHALPTAGQVLVKTPCEERLPWVWGRFRDSEKPMKRGQKGGEPHGLIILPIFLVREKVRICFLDISGGIFVARSEASANYSGPLMCPDWWLMLMVRNPLWKGPFVKDIFIE